MYVRMNSYSYIEIKVNFVIGAMSTLDKEIRTQIVILRAPFTDSLGFV